MPSLFENQVFIDLIRFTHVFAVAGGLGAALVADVYVLKSMRQKIDRTFLKNLHRYHGLVLLFLIPLWVTGLVLIQIRTGFDLANFSPKLWFKIGAVVTLTINGLVMGSYAFTALPQYQNRSLVDFPYKVLMRFGLLASISTTCWLLGLSFGISKFLAVSDASTLSAYALLVLSFITVTALAFLGAAALGFGQQEKYYFQDLKRNPAGGLRMSQSHGPEAHGHLGRT